MRAANQIAQTIISDSYFLKLYRVCVERSVLRTLNIDTEENIPKKKFATYCDLQTYYRPLLSRMRVITHIKSLPI